jgi:hypothetical protein
MKDQRQVFTGVSSTDCTLNAFNDQNTVIGNQSYFSYITVELHARTKNKQKLTITLLLQSALIENISIVSSYP